MNHTGNSGTKALGVSLIATFYIDRIKLLSRRVMENVEPLVLFQCNILSLKLQISGEREFEFSETLSNGRANYILFEELIRNLTGLMKTSQSDHISTDGATFEQKAFFDLDKFPGEKYDLFQTSASNTFGANNNGPKIKKLLAEGKYMSALEICKSTGYTKNDFYLYTNTRGFTISTMFKYFVIPTSDLLQSLDLNDPRLVSRSKLLAKIKSTKVI